MSRQLYIYSGITPNVENGIFLTCTTPKQIIDYLRNDLVAVIALDNYRVITNTIKINYDTAIFGLNKVNKISYIIDADIRGTSVYYFRAYFVDNYDMQSGFIVFNCHVDLWGTFAHNAILSNTLITKCNRNIGLGFYDKIERTKMEAEDVYGVYEPMGGISSAQPSINYMNDTNVSIVFFVACVISDNLAHDESVTQILPFACKLSDLRALFHATLQARYHSVEIATMVISGITQLKSTSWLANLDAQVLKMYIVPNDVLTLDEWGFMFISKSKVSEGMDDGKLEFEARAIRPSKTALPFEINVNQMDINKKYYVGVIGDGLELTHYTKNNYILFDFEVSHDCIQVVVKQGDAMKDITSHFQVSIIGNSLNEDALQKIAWWGKFMSGVIGKAQNIASSKNYAEMGMKGAQFVGDLLGQMGERAQATGTIGNSDGTITFDWYRGSTASRVNYPFYFNKYASVINEKERARRYGVNFREYDESTNIYILVTNILLKPLLGDGTFYPCLIACETNITGIPLEACKYIKGLLRSGLYLERAILPLPLLPNANN